jgi:hypothetical protein
MADDKRAANDPLKNAEPNPRLDEFSKSPEPWSEIAKLEWGGDRTHASTIQTRITDADVSQYPALEKKLLAVLADKNCTEVARDFVCRMLRLVGSSACVPALAKLLEDEKSADNARYALQTIPGFEVDAALRAALTILKGRAKAGLIGTLSARGDRDAQSAIKAIAADSSESADVRDAAMLAVATAGGAQ